MRYNLTCIAGFCTISLSVLFLPPPPLSFLKFHRDGGPSWLENIFQQWTEAGMVLRLDIRHWLHRWDSVVVKQTHAKYAAFMRAMAGAVLAYCDSDLAQLYTAIRRGDPRYQAMSDYELMHYVKPHQLKTYVRRLTRGVQVRSLRQFSSVQVSITYHLLLCINFYKAQNVTYFCINPCFASHPPPPLSLQASEESCGLFLFLLLFSR